MRTAQVSVHVVLYGEEQLPESYMKEHEARCAHVHSYCDSNVFSEALLGAVADVTAEVERIRGREFGVRRDLVSSANPEETAMAERLESSRPIDIRDIEALRKYLGK